MTRLSALTMLTAIVDDLNADEIEVLCWHAEKIRRGAAKHGPMQLDTDPRDFHGKEIREELMDAASYYIMGAIREERRRHAEAARAVNGMGRADTPTSAGLIDDPCGDSGEA